MAKHSSKFVFIILLLSAAGFFFLILNKSRPASSSLAPAAEAVQAVEPEQKKTEFSVESGDIFNKVAERAGLDPKAAYAIYNSAKQVYDLAKLRAGNKFVFYYDQADRLNKMIYAVDSEQELMIEKSGEEWRSRLEDIIYEIKEKTVEGEISSSLYQSALDRGADEGAVIEFAQSLEWSIDFANDPRVGDKYKFVYEERYRGGEYVMPGRVLAGAYLNAGKLYQSFYFEENQDNKGYFDAEGNSVQKMFLKAPLAFKYISSGFTTGRRYIKAFNVSTGHRAIDYAASYGTPIRAVGDGTVTFAGWSSAGYGYLTSIRHNGTYATNYGHQSKIIVKNGQRVSQGQVIGYVGSTGFSTGPHLHFEMVKNGIKVNPAGEILPPGKPIGQERKADFLKLVEEFKWKVGIN